MGLFSRKTSETAWSGSSSRDQERAAKRAAKEAQASSDRRARHRASLPRLDDDTPRAGRWTRRTW